MVLKFNIVKMSTTNIIKRRGFVDNNWSIYKVAKERTPVTWEDVFNTATLELKDISDILENDEKINGPFLPYKKDIFSAFEKTKLHDVSVVIFGQDPYPQMINVNNKILPRAVGMSYSVRKGDIIPTALKNIYKELYNSIENFVVPEHGDLTKWARQGILLLNTCLTINPKEQHKTSHVKSGIWMDFITVVIKSIISINPYTVFVLWGRESQKLTTMLGDRSIILTAPHPTMQNGFLGCNHFNIINDELEKQGRTPIDWSLTESIPDYLPFDIKCSDDYKTKTEEEKIDVSNIKKLVPYKDII